jgi:acetylornithine deacetylase
MAAHVDVVPIEQPERWKVDPFAADIIDGQIWGRGAVDDKDGLTGMLAALEALQRAGIRLRGDLILSSYVDEEFAGGNGLLGIVRKGYLGDAAINCDGSGFWRWVANTGGGPFRVLIQSRVEASHPTRAMRRLQSACLEALGAVSQELLAGWLHPLYPAGTSSIMRSAPIELRAWEEGLDDWNWITYGPPCGIAGYVTTLPGQERDAVKARVAAAVDKAYRDCDCPDVYPPRIEWTYRFMDACAVEPATPIVGVVGDAYQRVTGANSQVTGGVRSDLFMLALHGGVPTVSFGVGSLKWGSDGAAHQPNERIDIEAELLPYVKTLALAMMDWCGYVRA